MKESVIHQLDEREREKRGEIAHFDQSIKGGAIDAFPMELAVISVLASEPYRPARTLWGRQQERQAAQEPIWT